MRLDFNLGRERIIALALTCSLVAGGLVTGAALAQPGGSKRLARPTAAADAAPRSMNEDQQIAHLLNRITFGARPGDIERVKAQGMQKYIASQLDPASVPESQEVTSLVQNTHLLNMPSAQLIVEFKQFQKERKQEKRAADARQEAGKNAPNRGADGGDNMLASAGGPDNMQAAAGGPQASAAMPYKSRFKKRQFAAGGGNDAIAGRPRPGRPDWAPGANETAVDTRPMALSQLGDSKKRLGQGLMEARLARAIESNRQLQEVMTDFWYNHFNISIDKGLDHVLVGAYEEQAIRPHALGKFRDIVGATCHHPAMLFYLDNWQNAKPGGTDRKGKETGLNENYARELMELHTLGVDGGYTQKDVQELARVLTGLGLAPDRRAMATGDGKWGVFNPNRHDFSEKVVLGQRIAGSGEPEIEQCLDMLCKHPSTAHHIAFKLAQYFVADTPPPALVDKLASKFSQSDGDIKAVMTTLLNSPEFWDGRYSNDKYKSPFRYTVSVFRATETKPQDYQPVIQFLRMQGQPMYGCLTPDGYKNTQAAWLNPDALINRINFATAIGTGKAKFLSNAPIDFNRSRSTVNGGALTAKTEAVIDKAPPPLKLSLLIGSPEFMRY